MQSGPRRGEVRTEPVEPVKDCERRVVRRRVEAVRAGCARKPEDAGGDARARLEQLGALDRGRVGEQRLEELTHDPEGEVAFQLGSARPQHEHPFVGRRRPHRGQQRGLADAGGTFDHDEPASTRPGVFQRRFDPGQLVVSLEERRELRTRRGVRDRDGQRVSPIGALQRPKPVRTSREAISDPSRRTHAPRGTRVAERQGVTTVRTPTAASTLVRKPSTRRRELMSTTSDRAFVAGLRGDISGTVLSAEDAGYEAARAVHNGLVDRRPAVIVRCRTTNDVVAALAFARRTGLEVSVRGGGHNVAGRAVTDGGVMHRPRRDEGDRDRARARDRHGGGRLLWGAERRRRKHGLGRHGRRRLRHGRSPADRASDRGCAP